MASDSSPRPYRKRKRAESEDETRRRITEAAVELHGAIGPANTTLTQVAELAGVSRATVYNHFPTQVALFTACSTHWAAHNPFPDPSRWMPVADPCERLMGALGELYGWYGLKEGMLGKALRDAAAVPALAEVMNGFWGNYLEDVVRALAEGWSSDNREESRLHAILRLAVDFHTWKVLTQSGLDDVRAAELAARMVMCVEPGPNRGRGGV